MTIGNEELIKILHLEDDVTDSMLIKIQLQKDHIKFEYFFADNELDFLKFLNTQHIDIILSDYNLPGYSGSEALNFVKGKFQHIPFVFVSGTMGEEAAIQSLLNGATDYVLKNRLDRLGSAVRRALRESQLRQEYQKASETLRQREEQYRTLIEGMNEGLMLTDNLDNVLFVNQQTCRITGYSADELIGRNCHQILFEYGGKAIDPGNEDFVKISRKDIYEIEIFRKDQTKIWIRVSCSPVFDEQGNITGSIGVFEDINDRKKAEVELRKLTRAVDQSPDSIVITDTNGVIEYANPTTFKLTGFLKEELLGRKPSIFSSGEKSPEEYRQLWETIRSGKVWTGEFHNRKKSGELYWEAATISPIFNNEGKITHFLAIKEDVTERNRLNQELVAAKEKAEESDRLKSAFLANISHEIRTPMNGILGFSELLKNPDLKHEARQRYIEVIEQSGSRMLNIINDIVDISKIEAGQMSVNIQETNLNVVFRDLLAFYYHEAKAKELRFTFAMELPDNKCIIMTDHTKLYQILSNLIKNALKFTRRGSVEFGCKLTGPSNAMLEFYVQDTGSGIPEDQRSMIFERFRQGSISLSRSYEGAGLGLSISKAYVEMLGGQIGVRSQMGEGSSFHFTLPLKLKTKSNPETPQQTETEKEPIPINILLAEDDENGRLFLKTILEIDNMVVFEARNGKEAVALVNKIPELDLVLMDMQMPEMDGYEATRQIKKIRPELPVIAQTAYAFVEDQTKALEAGCDDYISKPLKRKALQEKIKKFTKK